MASRLGGMSLARGFTGIASRNLCRTSGAAASIFANNSRLAAVNQGLRWSRGFSVASAEAAQKRTFADEKPSGEQPKTQHSAVEETKKRGTGSALQNQKSARIPGGMAPFQEVGDANRGAQTIFEVLVNRTTTDKL